MRFAFFAAAILVAGQLAAQQAVQTNPTQTNPTHPDQSIRSDHAAQPGTQPAQDIRRDANRDSRPGTTVTPHEAAAPGQHKVMRASKITGLDVRNRANESLGEINDLVINPADGRIAYAAVSMGGFLGVGDKLFAVPFDAIEFREVEGDHVAVLDVSKQTMENAQGFDQDHWPDMANQQWRDENDRRYQGLRPRQHEVLRPVQPNGAQPGTHQPSTTPRISHPSGTHHPNAHPHSRALEKPASQQQ